MLLLNKHNLAVTDFASDEEPRYSLKAIKVTPGYTAATDGSILAIVTVPKTKADQFPTVPGFTPNGHKPFLLAKDICQKILKVLPRKTNIPVLKNACVSVDDEGNAQLAVTDLHNSQVFQQRPIEGNFPKLNAVFPKHPVLKISFNAEYLLTIAKMVSKFANVRLPAVTLEFYGPDKAMKFTATSDDGDQKLIGLLMPVRI